MRPALASAGQGYRHQVLVPFHGHRKNWPSAWLADNVIGQSQRLTFKAPALNFVPR